MVKKKDTNEIYAMKVLKKEEIVEKGQEGHTKSKLNLTMKLSERF